MADKTNAGVSVTSQLVGETLEKAVASIGGQPRPGQQKMALEVDRSIRSGKHLMVQAGTGTGKSLGYLIPILLREEKVMVATATLALQNQLLVKDVPIAVAAVEKMTGREVVAKVFKGRSNYACLARVNDLVEDQQDLLSVADLADVVKGSSGDQVSSLGAEVVMLRKWANQQLSDGGSGDRDDAVEHSQRAWEQVSVSARECVKAAKCPFGQVCFAEKAHQEAREADLVITNHALVAIDAMSENGSLPECEVLVIDEAHDLVNRVTGAASVELSPQMVMSALNRAKQWLSEDLITELTNAVEDFRDYLDQLDQVRRISSSDVALVEQIVLLGSLARRAISLLNVGNKNSDDVAKARALAGMQELFESCERCSGLGDNEVVYLSERLKFGRQLVAAPLSVSGLMRSRILAKKPTIFTSATLATGGNFNSVAGSVGLFSAERDVEFEEKQPADGSIDYASRASVAEAKGGKDDFLPWYGIDVGSPFDYKKQGILYTPTDLPAPGRDGISNAVLAEVVGLIEASGGHALALFASHSSAKQAGEFVRKKLPGLTVYCQGEGNISHLTSNFIKQSDSCLFGTLSLWQGVDAPGDTCRLVIIDKIPFPRPDDPLMLARKEAVDKSGGNGFMQVAANHAALLLAQGAGRLIRTVADRGVVAVLDHRLVTARYGSFLTKSLPDFWRTVERHDVLEALARLAAAES